MSLGGSEATTQSRVEYSPEQRQIMNAAMPGVMDFIRGGGTQLPGMSSIAGFNPTQQQGQQMALDAASGLSGFAGASTSAAQSLLNPGTNPHLEGAIAANERGIANNFATNIMPRLRGDAILTNNLGSSRQGIAEGIAGREAVTTAAEMGTKMRYDDYNNSRDRMLQAINSGGQIASNALAPSSIFDTVGGQRYALEGAQQQEAYNNELYRSMAPYLASSDVIRLAMGLGSGSSTTSTSQMSPMQAIMGGASTIAAFM